MKGLYQWKTNSGIGSQISANGIYTAGNNETGNSVIDIIIIKDTINNISNDAIATVLSREKVAQIATDATQKSHQETLSGRGTYTKFLIIIIVLIILTGIVLFWKIKR